MADIRILSHSGEPFKDRKEAGRLLAAALEAYRDKNAVILGIPRGGVVVAREVARGLGAELDVVLSRKLRTPGEEELAMGSVSEDGRVFLNNEVVGELGISAVEIEEETARQLEEIKRRAELLRRVRPRVPLRGRLVIVTDDGVATGATTQVALRAVRMEQPQKLVAAMPVAPEETILRLAGDADEVLCLRVPPFFSAVGQFYEQFYPVDVEEVLYLLRSEGAERRTGEE